MHPSAPYDPSAGLAPHIQALLAERAWLQRLARGLLTDASLADDLAQDVFVAALKSPPTAKGPGMRAWLATTARRMAARGSSREGYRGRIESEAHALAGRHEDRSADQRLELSESVIHGLQGISPEGRTALVMRYLEDEEYSTIAERLGLAESTVRQRVSRGLGELRRKLDEEHGDRTTWVAALAAAIPSGAARVGTAATASVKGAGGATPGVPASTKTLAAFLPAKKLLLILAALALLTLVPFLVLPNSGSADEAASLDSTTAAVAMNQGAQAQPSAPVDLGLTQTVAQRESLDAGKPPGAPENARADSGLRFRLEDSHGEAPAAARAAWVRGDGRVEEIKLGSDAVGALPTGAEGVVIARAPGSSRVIWKLQDRDPHVEIAVLQLRPLRTLVGRVDVNGSPPSHEFDIVRMDYATTSLLSSDWQLAARQREQLVEIGVAMPRSTFTRTRRDGSFEFEGVDEAGYGFLSLPSSFRNPRGRDAKVWSYRSESERLTLFAEELPYLHGRFEWADTGEGVDGSVTLEYRNMGRTVHTTGSANISADGRFELGLVEALKADGERRLRDAAIVIGVSPEGGGHFSPITVELDGLLLPHDLGVLKVERPRSLHVRVADVAGAPIRGASVLSEGGRSERTDEAGKVVLDLQGQDAFTVDAPGFWPTTVTAANHAHLGDSQELAVTLEPCVTLSLLVRGYKVGTSTRSRARFFVEFLPEDFHVVVDDETQTRVDALRSKIQADAWRFHPTSQPSVTSSTVPGEHWRMRGSCVDTPLLLGPLRPGASLFVGAVDTFGNDLVRKKVTVGTEPGITESILDLSDLHGNSITFEIVDHLGAPVHDAMVMPIIPGVGGRGEPARGGRITYAPVAKGPFLTYVQESGFLDGEEEGELTGGHQTVRVVMAQAQSIRMRFLDQQGRATRPTEVELEFEENDLWSGDWNEASHEVFFSDMPMGTPTARVTMGTRVVSIPVPAGKGPHTLWLPAFGTVEARLPKPLAVSDGWAELNVKITEKDNRSHSWELRESVTSEATGELRVGEKMLPGTYRIEATWIDQTGDDEADYPRTPLFEGEIHVRAGEVTSVDLGPR